MVMNVPLVGEGASLICPGTTEHYIIVVFGSGKKSDKNIPDFTIQREEAERSGAPEFYHHPISFHCTNLPKS